MLNVNPTRSNRDSTAQISSLYGAAVAGDAISPSDRRHISGIKASFLRRGIARLGVALFYHSCR